MIGTGDIVKSIARSVRSAIREVERRLASASDAVIGRPRKPALVPIPVRAGRRPR